MPTAQQLVDSLATLDPCLVIIDQDGDAIFEMLDESPEGYLQLLVDAFSTPFAAVAINGNATATDETGAEYGVTFTVAYDSRGGQAGLMLTPNGVTTGKPASGLIDRLCRILVGTDVADQAA